MFRKFFARRRMVRAEMRAHAYRNLFAAPNWDVFEMARLNREVARTRRAYRRA